MQIVLTENHRSLTASERDRKYEMPNGTGHKVGWIVELGVTLLSGFAILLSALTRIAWNTKLDKDKGREMVEEAMKQLALAGKEARQEMQNAWAEDLRMERELVDQKRKVLEMEVKAIREGMTYQNRASDRIENLVNQLIQRRHGGQ